MPPDFEEKVPVFGIPVRRDATVCAPDEIWIEGPTGEAVRVWLPSPAAVDPSVPDPGTPSTRD
jgi:hypothetical protein